MSEYWKSTERYWCKHCKIFVKDTKIERQNHDATPRHQGNLKRFVRDLHKNNDREEREKQRAKDEVARLNGVVSSGPSAARSAPSTAHTRTIAPSGSSKSQPGLSRKEQLQQLIDLGVAIPDEFRRELSMTGEWQTVSERIIDPGSEDVKVEGIGFGVRKREDRDEDEEEEEKELKRRRWESTHKTHRNEDDSDLDALLSHGIAVGRPAIKQENLPEATINPPSILPTKSEPAIDSVIPNLKREFSGQDVAIPAGIETSEVKQEDPAAGIVFKKRAKKNIRQK